MKPLFTGIALLAILTSDLSATEQDLDAVAREIVHRHPLVDTHIDVPYRIFGAWEDVTAATAGGDFDYPRAVQGGLNIPFMSIYTPADLEATGGSFREANQLIDSVEAMAGRAPDRFMLVHSVADVQAAMSQGRIGLAMGMENGSPLAGKLENVAFFARRGIRYITLTHSLSNHLSDSSFDANRPWKGLSDFGREVVREMNRVGVMIDISHVSDEAFWQVIEISQAPVIASHSSARHFVPGFERNMSDEMIQALAKKGGVIQVNFGSAFITAEANTVLTKLLTERAQFLAEHGLSADSPEAREWIAAFRKENPFPLASLQQVADHFEHIIKLVGVDHVGIGSDYDGVGPSLPVGLEDVSRYPSLVAELLRRGYTEADIARILGGNLLRVWGEVEAHASAR